MSGVARSPAHRLLGANIYTALKAATRRAFSDNGGVTDLSKDTRGCAETLRNYQTHGHDSFAPIDVIADAEAGAARPYVTEVLARRAGYDLVPRPEILPGGGAFHEALREAGEMIAETAAALADGRVDHAEAPGVLKELDDAARAIAVARAKLVDDHKHLEGGAS